VKLQVHSEEEFYIDDEDIVEWSCKKIEFFN
jgi:hypothetical protein